MSVSIFQKGVILVAVPLLAQGMFVAVVAWFQERYVEVQERSQRTMEVLHVGRRLEEQVIGGQSATCGYVLTGDRSFLNPESAALGGDLDRLVELVANDPPRADQARRVADLARRAAGWQAELVRMADAGDRAGAVGRIQTREGKELVDALRAELGDFLAAEERLDAEQEAGLNRARKTVNGLLAGGAAVSFAATVCLAVLFGRGFSRRLAVLAENARRLPANKPLAPPVGGADEIAQVDRAFHQMAAEVRALTHDLEGRVRARTAELTEANRELALRNQDNELFVYSVSHDLRGPLVNLQGFSKELAKAADALRALFADERTPAEVREAARPIFDQKVSKALGFIQSAVSRLGGIIDALLRLSRAGRVEYRWEEVNMNRLVGQLLGSLQGTITEKGATVGASNLPPAYGDATALGQVFANLVGNALTYLDPARPGVIEVGGSAGPDGSVTYFVRDNGRGIPAAHRGKVFHLFQRAHPGVGTGEGLGLAIVARVVERHRGRVWVESTEGQGSTFFVRLPGPVGGGA